MYGAASRRIRHRGPKLSDVSRVQCCRFLKPAKEAANERSESLSRCITTRPDVTASVSATPLSHGRDKAGGDVAPSRTPASSSSTRTEADRVLGSRCFIKSRRRRPASGRRQVARFGARAGHGGGAVGLRLRGQSFYLFRPRDGLGLLWLAYLLGYGN
jgi:hypothetical protein